MIGESIETEGRYWFPGAGGLNGCRVFVNEKIFWNEIDVMVAEHFECAKYY